MWDSELGTVTQDWLAHWGPIHALGLSPDSKRLVSGGGESGEALVVWDINKGVSQVVVVASIDNQRDAVIDCSWSPDGAWIASASRGGIVFVWDTLAFKQLASLLSADDPAAYAYYPRCLQWSPDSRYLVWAYSVSRGGESTSEWAMWDILRPKDAPRRFPAHPRNRDFSITALSFDPKSRRIAFAIAKFVGRGMRVPGSHSEEHNISGERTECVQIWDVITGATPVILGLEHETAVHTVAFSLDGRSLLSVSKDSLVKIWNTVSWQNIASLEGDGGTLPTACFSPDGKYIAAASNNIDTRTFTVRLWGIGDASCMAVFTEHKHIIRCLAFSPNGETLVSGDDGGLVHIHRVSSFMRGH